MANPRVGDYRVIYEIRDYELIVFVVSVAHRRKVCRAATAGPAG